MPPAVCEMGPAAERPASFDPRATDVLTSGGRENYRDAVATNQSGENRDAASSRRASVRPARYEQKRRDSDGENGDQGEENRNRPHARHVPERCDRQPERTSPQVLVCSGGAGAPG
jgi:hypothetical protein